MKTFVIIFGQLLVEIGLLYNQTSGHTGCEYSFYQKTGLLVLEEIILSTVPQPLPNLFMQI